MRSRGFRSFSVELSNGCHIWWPMMQSSHFPVRAASDIFNPSTNVLLAISWVVRGLQCAKWRCHFQGRSVGTRIPLWETCWLLEDTSTSHCPTHSFWNLVILEESTGIHRNCLEFCRNGHKSLSKYIIIMQQQRLNSRPSDREITWQVTINH